MKMEGVSLKAGANYLASIGAWNFNFLQKSWQTDQRTADHQNNQTRLMMFIKWRRGSEIYILLFGEGASNSVLYHELKEKVGYRGGCTSNTAWKKLFWLQNAFSK